MKNTPITNINFYAGKLTNIEVRQLVSEVTYRLRLAHVEAVDVVATENCMTIKACATEQETIEAVGANQIKNTALRFVQVH
jgi:hypothetical protein